MIPIVTGLLDPIEYSKIALFQSLIAFSALFINFGISDRYFRHLYNDKKDYRNNYFYVALVIINLFFLIIIITLFPEYFMKIFRLEKSELYFAVLSSGFLLIFGFVQSKNQKENAVWKYGAYSVSIILILNIFIFFSISHFYNAYSRNFSYLIVYFVVGVCSCFYLLRGEKLPSLSSAAVIYKSTIKFGFGLFPHQVMNFTVFHFDKVVLTALYSQHFTGLFFAYWQISAALLILIEAANKAYVPFLYSKLSSGSLKIVHLISFAAIVMFLGIIFWSITFEIQIALFIFILPQNYYEYVHLAPYFVLMQIFYAIYLIFSNVLFYFEKSLKISLTTFASVAVFYVLLFALQGDPNFVIFCYIAMTIIRILMTMIQAIKLFKASSI
jgi:O-antigen/teichoic acid export membrane protein